MTRRMVPLVGGGSITVDDEPERAVVRVWSAAWRFLGFQVPDAPIGTV